jgi:hypothetical protein
MAALTSTVLAIGWEPELRGLLVVLIGFTVLCGGVYLVIATNLGARLGFMVALTGLAGWMSLMGAIWWVYGIGLKGPDPTWDQIPGRTVIQDVDSLFAAGVLDEPVRLDGSESFPEQSELVRGVLEEEDWRRIAESEPAFGQASASAGEFLEEEEAFEAGDFQVTAVYETGGKRYPKINDSLDFLAFRHEPKYALVEVAPLAPLREEPGRAPTPPEIDDERQRQYVYMARNLGARRQPAAAITIGSSIVFLALCFMLHRRDRFVAANLQAKRDRELVTAS